MYQYTACPEDYKRCSLCQECFPATPQYFYREKLGKFGLTARCKYCTYLMQHDLVCLLDLSKMTGKKQCTRCKQFKTADKFYPAKRGKFRRRPTCIECDAQMQHEKLPVIREKRRERYKKNPNVQVQIKRWQSTNSGKVQRYKKAWKTNNPKTVQIHDLCRRARISSLPNSFTADDYQRMMSYWGNACAITGVTDDLHIDHWIPIADPNSLGTVPGNMLPMAGRLNLRKSAKHPHVWLRETFGEDQAQAIIERIEAYFEWVREQAIANCEINDKEVSNG